MNTLMFMLASVVCLVAGTTLAMMAVKSSERRGLRAYSAIVLIWVGVYYLIAALSVQEICSPLPGMRAGTLGSIGVMFMAGAIAALALAETEHGR